MRIVLPSTLLVAISIILFPTFSSAQLKWQLVDSMFQPLPKSVHVYYTDEKIDTGAFKAYYVVADLKDKRLEFDVDTTFNRRLTPTKFYEKDRKPLAVVNCTFFSFETNRNLNTIIKDGKLIGFSPHTVAGKGKDTLTYRHPYSSAIGISRSREADVAWVYADSSEKYAYYRHQEIGEPVKDSIARPLFRDMVPKTPRTVIGMDVVNTPLFDKWKMKTAVGGGPVLLLNGQVRITNNEELKFAGKAIKDKHPRTAMGYTNDSKLIVLVIQGRSESSGGATLQQEAQILKDLDCWEALNLDGGGSSCLLVNGKETIKPSDKEGQRAVPAVFLIRDK